MGLRRHAEIVLKWWWLLILATALAGGSSWYVSNAQPRVYRASAMLLVNQAQDARGLDYSSVLMSEKLTRTYAELIKKGPVLSATIQKLGLPLGVEELDRLVDVRVVRDTQLLELSAEHERPELARDIANTLAEVFIAQRLADQVNRSSSSREVLQRQIREVERQVKETGQAIETARGAAEPNPAEVGRLQTLLSQQQATYSQLLKSELDLALAEARSSDSLKLAVPAEVSPFPVRPKVLQNTAVAAVVGLLLALGVAFLVEYLDDTVKGEEEVQATTGHAVLAAIARVQGRKMTGPRLLEDRSARSPHGEAYRVLRANIDFAWAGKPGKVLMVTSANPGEGKSTTLTNLAVMLAEDKRRVVVVDADLRRPSVHRAFGLDVAANQRGLSNLLAHPTAGIGHGDWLERWANWTDREPANRGTFVGEFLQPTAFPNLFVLPSGPIPPNPSELLGSPHFGQIVDKLRQLADVVLVDAPPVLGVVDPAVIAGRVDGAIVVAVPGSTRLAALARSVETLAKGSARVLGIVLNKVGERSSGYYYYYHRDYYHAEASSSKGRNGGDRDGRDESGLDGASGQPDQPGQPGQNGVPRSTSAEKAARKS